MRRSLLTARTPQFAPLLYNGTVGATGAWNTVTTTGASTNLALSKPSGTATGSLLLTLMGATGATTFSPPSNTQPWTSEWAASGAASYSKMVASGAAEPSSNYTFTQTSGLLSNRGLCMRFENVAAIIDRAATTGSGAAVSPSVTATKPGQYLISMVLSVSTSAAITAPASMTQIWQWNTGTRAVAVEQLTASGATGTRSWVSTAGNHGVISFILETDLV